MTLEIGFLFAVLAVMVYLFLTEKLPVDLTAFLGLTLLILTGYLEPDEAFTGFASTAVITMLAIFIVSAALLRTGVADLVGGRIHGIVGSREVPLIVLFMVVAGVLSAFMNNIAATAVLMPAVAAVAKRASLHPSRLFMPLAFGAILGGTTTLVGTPPNIIAGALLEERGMEPFGLFDFTPMGLALLAAGVLFMMTVGRRLLPRREAEPEQGAPELTQAYRLQERLFSIRLPEGSSLDGVSLGKSRLGTALGVQVASIVRGGKRQLAPSADTELEAGDELVVEGRIEDLEELLAVRDVVIEEAPAARFPRIKAGVTGIRLRLTRRSPLVGRSLREVRFRERFHVVVVGVRRGEEVLRDQLGQLVLEAQDRILALGTHEQAGRLSETGDFEVRAVGLDAVQQLQKHLFLIAISEPSPLVGKTIQQSRIGELIGLTVGGLMRGDHTQLSIDPDEVLQAGDKLLVAGEPDRIVSLLELGEVQLDPKVDEESLESDEVAVFEATVAPRSSVATHTLAQLDFRRRYGLQVLAVWREGKRLAANLAQVALRFGDALLLQGSREQTAKLARDEDFVVLTPDAGAERRTRKAPFALGGLALMVGLVVSGWQPIHVAAFTAASVTILFGAITMQEAYRAIEWRAIFLVAAVLPVGVAMERTGAADLLAGSVSSLAGPFGPYAVMAALIVLSSMLSQGLDGAPAVVLLTPVALDAAREMGLSPYPVMMGVSLAASAAFMTPFSHKANLLVMGAGGYRSIDYVRVGTPLTVVVLALLVFLVPVFLPF